MAAAVFEAVEQNPASAQGIDIRVEPGITAMLAAAARIGAPLGHDFCAISLSDNLKPWATIEKRLRLAAEADFVIALYNPASKARPDQIGKAFEVLSACPRAGNRRRFCARRRPQRRVDRRDDARRCSRHGRAICARWS